MIQTTTWSPDTCSCTLHYQWDDAVKSDKRVHTPVEEVTAHDGKVIRTTRCEFHNHPGVADLHTSVITENQTKNIALDQLAKAMPALTVTDEKGNVSLKPDIVIWSFDENRNLKLNITSLDDIALTLAQDALDESLGNGKVSVVSEPVEQVGDAIATP